MHSVVRDALVSASAALAADLPTYKAPPAPTLAVTPPPYSWTGFYIGVGGGASALQVDSKSRSWLWGYNSSVTGDYPRSRRREFRPRQVRRVRHD